MNVVVIIVNFYTNKVLNHLGHSLILVLQIVKVHTDHLAVPLVFVTHINVVNAIVVKVVAFPMMVTRPLLLTVHSAISATPEAISVTEVVPNREPVMHFNAVNVIVVTVAVSRMAVVSTVDSHLRNLETVSRSNVVNVVVVMDVDFLMKLVAMHLPHSPVDQNHALVFKRVIVIEAIHANSPMPQSPLSKRDLPGIK